MVDVLKAEKHEDICTGTWFKIDYNIDCVDFLAFNRLLLLEENNVEFRFVK